MKEKIIDGVQVRYHVAWNVSHNRANPHRLTAVCECGVQFVEMSCSDRVSRNLDRWLLQLMRFHKASGYCHLMTTSAAR